MDPFKRRQITRLLNPILNLIKKLKWHEASVHLSVSLQPKTEIRSWKVSGHCVVNPILNLLESSINPVFDCPSV